MFKPSCVLMALVFASPLATAEIFKCTRDGATVYQNFTCDVESIGSKATATAPPEQTATLAVSAPERIQRPPRKVKPPEEKLAGPPTEPRVGMTKNQVKASTWGEPVDIVKEEVVEGWTQAWYYDLQKKRSVLFDVRGVVSSVTQ